MPECSLSEKENALRWDGKSRGHYEVYYMTFNHIKSGRGFWIRYTMTSPVAGGDEPWAQLWVSCFDATNPDWNFAITKKFPISELSASTNPFSLRIGACSLSLGAANGSLSGDGHDVSWNLSFAPGGKVHYMLPQFIYKAELADTLALVPEVNAKFNGEMIIDGERLEFSGDPGCQTHLWGSKHAVRWAWAHCNAYDEDDTAVFEGLSVQIERFGIELPPMSIFAVWHNGEKYDMTGVGSMLTSSCKFETGKWKVHGSRGNVRFECEFECRPENLVRAEYTDPDGDKAWCHNTETGFSRIKIFRRDNLFAKWKLDKTLTCRNLAHMEFAARKKDPAVHKNIVEV